MKSTIHKGVRNVKAAPNPTQYTNIDKYTVKAKNDIGPKLVRHYNYHALLSVVAL